NVVAELPGTEKPDELVIVGGHLDSWDGATGATDNGTGVATTLEAARLLTKAGAKPKRTIRFMLWSGEEQGLLLARLHQGPSRRDAEDLRGARPRRRHELRVGHQRDGGDAAALREGAGAAAQPRYRDEIQHPEGGGAAVRHRK